MPPDTQTITRSCGAMRPYAPIASPTWRRRRFRSLFASNSAFRGSRRGARPGRPQARPAVAVEGRVAGGVSMGLVILPAEAGIGAKIAAFAGAGQGDSDADDSRRQSQRRQRQDDARDQRRRLARGQAPAMWSCATSIPNARRRNGSSGVRRCFRRSPGSRGNAKHGNKEAEHDWRVVDTPGRTARRRPARSRAPRRRDARAADAVGVRHGGGAPFPHRDPGATRRSGRASSRSASSRCASIRAPHSAAELDAFLEAFEFPVIAHLRDTQVYVHCARDGASVFDLPRSRGEQDWEQWKPLTRWITRHTSQGLKAR